MKLAQRLSVIEPFYVMECAKAAAELARSPACQDTPMIFLNIGEPDFTAPQPVREAGERALRLGRTQYTAATGLTELRERISQWYATRWGLTISPHRIVVTAGASAALQLACLALIDPGDEVLMPDPSYPCNRHFVAAAGGIAKLLVTSSQTRFQPDAEMVNAAWSPRTRGVLLASPSNPTGTSIETAQLQRIVQAVRERGGVTIVDEIYLGLSYGDAPARSALALGEDVISINSFSKYFAMTGWRLGWLVVPEDMVQAVERLAQNLYICPPTPAQHAALACFEPSCLAEFEDRRLQFRARRDHLVPALEALGLGVPCVPDGAFYAWVDCSAHATSSWAFCERVLHRAHVALTPGRDFGRHDIERYVRVSFASALSELQLAVERLRGCL